jgi:hypothetical protein
MAKDLSKRSLISIFHGIIVHIMLPATAGEAKAHFLHHLKGREIAVLLPCRTYLLYSIDKLRLVNSSPNYLSRGKH